MANGTGSISYGPYGTLTFTDGQNYRVTIPTPAGANSANPTSNYFHLYRKDVVVNDMTAFAVQNWVINNPTAHSTNNAANPAGAPNDATPGFGFRELLAGIIGANNDVHSYTVRDEISGQIAVINVTDASHVLHFGAVIQIVTVRPDGSILLSRYGIGDGWITDYGDSAFN